jgi:hypothetical protein
MEREGQTAGEPPEPRETLASDAIERLLSNPDLLVDVLAEILSARASAIEAEQAVRGLDALGEVEFHPLLAEGLIVRGIGVVREALFPGDVEALAKKRAKRAERERCDLVLLPRVGAVLLDPVRQNIDREDAQQTLFAAVEPAPEADGVRAEDAYWLEVKAVGQFTYSNGWVGANTTYSSELVRATTDLTKIARDRHIHRGGLLLIVFTRDQATADHDLRVLFDRCVERNLPIRTPTIARFTINDRIGNGLCTLWLAPVRSGTDYEGGVAEAHH